MVSTWIIEELERRRRTLERRERPQLRIEPPVRGEEPAPAPAPRTPIVIELGG